MNFTTSRREYTTVFSVYHRRCLLSEKSFGTYHAANRRANNMTCFLSAGRRARSFRQFLKRSLADAAWQLSRS